MIVERPWFFRAIVLISLAGGMVYLAMLVITLPALDSLSGGLPIFDMRIGGYNLDDARALVTALGPEGIDYYLSRQLMLDNLLPALIAASLSGWTIIVARKLRDAGMIGLMSVASLLCMLIMVSAIVDYSENGAIRIMLTTSIDNLDTETVQRASMMTIVKFTTLGLSFAGLAAMLGKLFASTRNNQS